MTYHENGPYIPKIVVMNINPENINNCITHTIHGAKLNTSSVGNVGRLSKGDICIIRRTSRGGRYRYGVVGIWYYHDKEDIEGLQEPLWIPPDVWKYKIFMKPFIKKFERPFYEDFSKNIPRQLRHKESTKVMGLVYTSIQGAVSAPRDKDLLRRYLKAIIEEKRIECDKEAEYEDYYGNRVNVNVYDFLNDLV